MSERPGYRGQFVASRAWQAAGAWGTQREIDYSRSLSQSCGPPLSMCRVTKSSDCWGRRGFGIQGGATCSGSHSLSPGSFLGSALTVIYRPTLDHSYLVPTQETSRFWGKFQIWLLFCLASLLIFWNMFKMAATMQSRDHVSLVLPCTKTLLSPVMPQSYWHASLVPRVL